MNNIQFILAISHNQWYSRSTTTTTTTLLICIKRGSWCQCLQSCMEHLARSQEIRAHRLPKQNKNMLSFCIQLNTICVVWLYRPFVVVLEHSVTYFTLFTCDPVYQDFRPPFSLILKFHDFSVQIFQANCPSQAPAVFFIKTGSSWQLVLVIVPNGQ